MPPEPKSSDALLVGAGAVEVVAGETLLVDAVLVDVVLVDVVLMLVVGTEQGFQEVATRPLVEELVLLLAGRVVVELVVVLDVVPETFTTQTSPV